MILPQSFTKPVRTNLKNQLQFEKERLEREMENLFVKVNYFQFVPLSLSKIAVIIKTKFDRFV